MNSFDKKEDSLQHEREKKPTAYWLPTSLEHSEAERKELKVRAWKVYKEVRDKK